MAPYYCAMYPKLVEFFRARGYALAVHGSVATDFDLIAVPWVMDIIPCEVVVEQLCEEFNFRLSHMTVTLHGRKIYTVVISWDNCYLDLSFIGVK